MNFLNLRFNAIEKQSIINLSCYRSKSFASVVLGDSMVTFLREGEDAILCPSLYCVLVIYGIAKRSSKSSNFLIFHTSGGILSRPAAFLLLIFLSTLLSSSRVNYPSLMSCWLLIISVISLSVTFGKFSSRFLKCSFHVCSRSSLYYYTDAPHGR